MFEEFKNQSRHLKRQSIYDQLENNVSMQQLIVVDECKRRF